MNKTPEARRAAAKALERRRKQQRTSVVVVLLAALLGYTVYSFIGGDDTEVDPTDYTPPEDVVDEVIEDDTDRPDEPIEIGESQLQLGLDPETGRVSGTVTYGGDGALLLGEDGSSVPLTGSTGGTGSVLADGSCSYSDPCHDGLPVRFSDDLEGIVDVSGVGVLPVDRAHWYRARTECYRSPWLVADCNLELALGGYGVLANETFDDECLARQYKTRMSFDSDEPSGWWLCSSEWWDPEMPDGAAKACEAALTHFAFAEPTIEPEQTPPPTPTTAPAAEIDGEDGEDGEIEEDPPAAAPTPTTAPAVVADAGADENFRFCTDLAAVLTDNGQNANTSNIRCRIARTLLARSGNGSEEYVPVCGVSLRPPIDTHQLRRQADN